MKENINYKELVTDALTAWNTAINLSENLPNCITKLYFKIDEHKFKMEDYGTNDAQNRYMNFYKINIFIKDILVFKQEYSHTCNEILAEDELFNRLYYRIYHDTICSGVNNLYVISMQLKQQREERLKPIKDE